MASLRAPLILVVSVLAATAITHAAHKPTPTVPLDQLKGAEKLAALIARVSENQKAVTTLQAGFEQRKESRLLAAPSLARGRFYFQAPDTVRWEYESPRVMTVLVKDGVVTTYRPAEKRAERVEIGRVQRRIFRFVGAAQPLDQLKRYFSFTFRDPGAAGDYQLVLTPTAHVIKKRLKSVEIDIDRTSLMPVKVSYAEADGDTTAYLFTDIATNRPIDASQFALDLPADVEVVHLRVGSSE